MYTEVYIPLYPPNKQAAGSEQPVMASQRKRTAKRPVPPPPQPSGDAHGTGSSYLAANHHHTIRPSLNNS